ncbi:hypothetical protein [Azospirillum sp.]|uniref:hypothetical protein n=1 Tax=Azospirillum sp. TaxID=34012 RepID=UPI002D35A120|nr:hypothetical protein [Azospirillum sp.]HYD70428.1 hypothetical protein [Azospirillum sp.]
MPVLSGGRGVRAVVLVAGMMAGMAMLGGCAMTGSRYAQPSDACFVHRKALDTAGQGFAGSPAEVTDAAEAGAYWQARRARTRDRGRLYNAVLADADAEVHRLGALRTAFDRLMDCRRAQAAELREAWSSGRTPRWEARGLLDELAEAVGADRALADDIAVDLERRTEQLAHASERMSPGTGAKVRARAMRRAALPARDDASLRRRVRVLPTGTLAADKAAARTVRMVERLLEGRERFRLARAAVADPIVVTGRW